jgi:hypothetical protein
LHPIFLPKTQSLLADTPCVCHLEKPCPMSRPLHMIWPLGGWEGCGEAEKRTQVETWSSTEGRARQSGRAKPDASEDGRRGER